tara:strand:- start:223 stop:1923 length:1701 start_codon:yes stop_codon:yes gene_type:complete
MSKNVQYKRKCTKYEKKIQDLLKNELDENEENVDKSWVEISNNVRKSIVQIFVSSHTIDPMKPYIYPPDKLVRGSGFVIHNDNNKILIMTNSHVVKTGKIINIRTELTKGVNLKVNIINMCIEKDIAILEIVEEDLKYFKGKYPNKLYFDDARILDDTIEVLTAGYPLGEENIKFTTGVLSGNQQNYDIEFDRNISYLQIDAPINPGNSGGPLFNKTGKVIGINSAAIDGISVQNVCFAIPSNIIVSVIYDLLHNIDNNKILKIPNVNFKWNNCNDTLFESLDIKTKDISGIHIYNISKVSFLKFKKGDILFKIKMKDIWEEKDILNINNLLEINDINKVYKKNKKIEIIIDNKGLINIYILDKKNNIVKEHQWTLNRKVSIEEFFDSIPNNIRLDLFIIRNNKIENYSCISSGEEDIGIKSITPMHERIDWEICLGCCFTPLNMSLIEVNVMENINLAKYLLKENRLKDYVCITNTFRNTDIADTNVLDDDKIGIISKINDKEIRTMDDLRKILYKYRNSYYNIEFESGKKIILSDVNKKARIIDKELLEEYNIFPTEFSKKWLI